MSLGCQVLVKGQKVGFNLWFAKMGRPRLDQHLQMIKFFLRFRLLLLTETLAVLGKVDENAHQKGIFEKIASNCSGSMIVSATRFARLTCLEVVWETKCPPGEVGCCCEPEKPKETDKPDSSGDGVFDHVFVTHSSTFLRQARFEASFLRSV
jgi:hypothetical protein